MAKFLNTRKAISEIEDLIKNAGQTLTLISPYLKLSKDFKELLTYRNGRDKVTTVIFGKQELNPDEMKFLQGLRFIVLRYHEDLHAKCYVNDERMIITSLNLYEFSMANNKEMGVMIDKNDPADAQLFADANKEVEYITQTSQRFEIGVTKNAFTKQANTISANNKPNLTGYCIRTGAKIPFNPEKPLSYDAYQIWSQYGDPDYPEKYCHFTGENSNGETSVSKPILRKNWQKAKDAQRLTDARRL
jgi:phosphatidylserine/phosphatidylglycerophosphate/cardiolipin synthase-like enzyme